MKKSLFLILIAIGLFSQGIKAQPDLINYQTIVRDASGNVIVNQDVSFLISIVEDSETGNIVFSEKHYVNTNQFGLVNLQIGNGEVETGSIAAINWGTTSHFLKLEFDPSGGSSFIHMGTVQLLSVPYAFHAKTVENDNVNDADADATNELQTISISGTVLTLSNNGGSVTLPSSGTGGDNWGTQTVVVDETLTGEGTQANPLSVNGDLTDDQTLSISGNELSISEGNSVTLPATGDNWGAQFAYTNSTLEGDGLLGDPLKIARQEATTGQILGWDGTTWKPKDDETSDADNDASNELQTISISGTVLTLSNNGGSVTLPSSGSGGDNWGTQTVIADASLTGEGTSADPLSVNGDLTDDQTLSISGNNLTISDGNTVSLPEPQGDDWGTQSVVTDATLTGEGTLANPLEVIGDLSDDQILSISGNNLTISEGNTVALPLPEGDDWGDQSVQTDVTLEGDGTSANPLKLAQQSAAVNQVLGWDGLQWNPLDIDVNDADADVTNELQTISISGTQLTLSNGGGTVSLPSAGDGGDNWGTQSVVTNSTLTGEGTTANPLGVNGDLTDDQTLSISGDELTISEGNSVTLPVSPGDGDAWGVTGENISSSISRNGNVGIGEPNPKAPLHIQTEYSEMARFESNVDSKMISFYQGDDRKGTIWNAGDNMNLYSDEGGIGFFTNGNNQRIRIDKSGNVGINTDNPEERLHIEGTVKIVDGTQGDGKVLTSDANGSASWQNFPSGSDGDAWGVSGEDQANAISRNGNVGIATANPQSQLSVGGNGTGSEAIYAESQQSGESAVFGYSASSSGNGSGGSFTSSGNQARAVFGNANSTTGSTYGGYFQSLSSDGTGVFGAGEIGVSGITSISGGIAVYGISNVTSGNSHGGYFDAPGNGGRGIYGFGGDYGVHGSSENGWGGAFSNTGNTNISVLLAGRDYAMIIRDGNEGLGKVLTSDETGYATWQDAPSGSDGDAWGVTGEDLSSVISRSGKVGIGTSNPNSSLSVGGNGILSCAISGIESEDSGIGICGFSTSSSGNGYGGDFYSAAESGAGIVASCPNWGGIFSNSSSQYSVVLGGRSYALKIHDGNEGAGKVLTSDAEGNASWQDLPATSGDDWGNQVVVSYSSLTGNGTFASPLEVNGDLTDDQTLSISGNDLTISGGNTVTLPGSSSGDGDAWGVSGEDQSSNIYRSGWVGIGTTSVGHPIQAQGNTSGGAGHFINTISSSDQYGVYGKCANSDYYGYGGYFKGGYTGVLGIVQPSGSSNYIGIFGRANGGSGSKYGARGQATGSGTNYGVYGEASGGTNNYGVYCVGNGVYTGTWSQSSDKKLKKNFEPLCNALGKISHLQPKYFDYRTEEFPEMNLPQNRQMGFIAQEIQEVIPELVHSAIHIRSEEKDSDKIEYLTVDYVSVIPILTAAVQELNNLVNEKQEEIDALHIQNEQIIKRLEDLEQLFEASIDR